MRARSWKKTRYCAGVFSKISRTKPEDIGQFGSAKLLGTLSQLALICRQEGLDLISDSGQVCAKWDPTQKVGPLERLFALNILRTSDAHNPSTATAGKGSGALGAFKIEEAENRSGWGRAVDEIYDQTTGALEEIGQLMMHLGSVVVR